MNIEAIVFDINGTLIDIRTDQGNEEVYRAISLTYQGIFAELRQAIAFFEDLKQGGGTSRSSKEHGL